MTQRLPPFEFALMIVVAVQLSSCNPTGKESDHSLIKQENPVDVDSLEKKSSELLRELFRKWTTIESSFSDVAESRVTMEAVSAAGGHAIYTVYSQGLGQGYYEASALWGFSKASGQIRVFEANTVGIADTHIGYFDSTSTLRLELRDPSTSDLLQQRSMRWENDTLRMDVLFIDNGKRTEHHLDNWAA